MSAITVKGFWSLDAMPVVVERRDAAQLLVAPVGSHPHRTRLVRVDVDDHLAAALRLELEGGFRPPAERASGLEWLDLLLGGRRESLGRFTPAGDPSRAVLVASRAERNPWGARSLQGPSGFRLASLIGIGLDVLLGTFETVNIERVEAGTQLGVTGAEPEALVARLKGRHVVVAGRDALFDMAAVVGALPNGIRDGRWAPEHLSKLRRALGARSLRTIPHPSGRGHGVYHVAERVEASAVLLAAALDARGVPHLAGPWETIAADVVLRCLGPGLGRDGASTASTFGPNARAALRHLAAAWVCLGRAGVTWEGSLPSSGWRPGPVPRSWTRAWDVAHAGRQAEILEVVPGARGWTVRAPIEPGTWPVEVDDEDGALLWATWLARSMLGPSAWERRRGILRAQPNGSASPREAVR